MRPKFILLSGATYHPPEWRHLIEFTFRINAQWALSQGGYAHMAKMDPLPPPLYRDATTWHDIRPPSWCKLREIYSALRANVLPVLWVDADCIIKLQTTYADLAPAPAGSFRTMHDENGINCGVMSFQHSQWLRKFIMLWWMNATLEEINHPWWEQSTLHRLAKLPEHAGKIGEPLPSIAVIHAAGIPIKEKRIWIDARIREEIERGRDEG